MTRTPRRIALAAVAVPEYQSAAAYGRDEYIEVGYVFK
jgi:hypothetical protein